MTNFGNPAQMLREKVLADLIPGQWTTKSEMGVSRVRIQREVHYLTTTHLQDMVKEGLLEFKKNGRRNVYRLVDSGPNQAF